MDDALQRPEADDSAEAGLAFLTVQDVRELHRQLLLRFSRGESHAILHPGLLESAVLHPQQSSDGRYL